MSFIFLFIVLVIICNNNGCYIAMLEYVNNIERICIVVNSKKARKTEQATNKLSKKNKKDTETQNKRSMLSIEYLSCLYCHKYFQNYC